MGRPHFNCLTQLFICSYCMALSIHNGITVIKNKGKKRHAPRDLVYLDPSLPSSVKVPHGYSQTSPYDARETNQDVYLCEIKVILRYPYILCLYRGRGLH